MALKSLPVHPFNALIFPILRDCLQSVCIFLNILCCWRLMYVCIFLVKDRVSVPGGQNTGKTQVINY